jgi:hypothetical protein|tara:strand:- start:1594 stop:1893 length:300 start_codon:yes stop_codon:yes gene_type:complete
MRQNLFSPNVIDLGEVKVGKTVKVIFQGTGGMLEVKSLSSSCGCTKPRLINNNIETSYTPKAISPHLASQGHYMAQQNINVVYKNGDTELLILKAKVIK